MQQLPYDLKFFIKEILVIHQNSAIVTGQYYICQIFLNFLSSKICDIQYMAGC